MIILSLPGNQVSVDIVPRTKARIIFKVGNKILNSADEVKALIQDALNEALIETIFEVEIWIDIHIPKRSGDLIENIKKFLRKSIPPPSTIGELRGVRLVLGAGADVKYAMYVNKMTSSMVRHLGTWREHSGALAYSKGSPVYLDDPRAVGFFFDKMVDFAVERLNINLDKVKYKLQSSTSLTSRDLTQLRVSE